MFSTPYGNFDGSSWEAMMQIIFKRKFQLVKYQRIPATPGDFGIEGFTKDGQTFQCYCPDVNSDNKTIYEKQRQKVTDDINKLKEYEKELIKILGGTKLKTWVLVTPRIGHHDLISHCNKKRDLVKSWNLPFIENSSFEVIIHEIEDYAGDIGEYFQQAGKKLTISPNQNDIKKEKIVEWKDTEIDLINNALEKNQIRVSAATGTGNAVKVNELTHETAKHYLNGESILKRWQSSQPDNHQRFIELVASVEDELKEKSLLNNVDPNQFVREITDYMEGKIKSSFPYLDESTIIRLKHYSVSSWILRCPLYFEIE